MRQDPAAQEFAGLDDFFGPRGSRYAAVSRRAFLARLAALGLAGPAAATVITACGRNDAAVFARGVTGSSPGDTSQIATSPSAADPTARAGATSSTRVLATSTTPTSSNTANSVRGTLAIRFTYAVVGGGSRFNNPYVAVWIEDNDQHLVATVALWYLQGQKGSRWLPELRRWYQASSATRAQTVSGPTRAPGTYSVTWDGTTADGSGVAQGAYAVCIEAAREHGPYSLIRQSVTIGNQSFKTDLPSNGELTDASIEFTAR
ncbi:MAG: DUF2271 domain-containing protein [Acidimicrobiales bacterium]|nr:DUF2271 domain-containing protein [Acidimicrobiales bacterium]